MSFRIRACISELCSEFSREISTTVGVQDIDPTATPENIMAPNPLLPYDSFITWPWSALNVPMFQWSAIAKVDFGGFVKARK